MASLGLCDLKPVAVGCLPFRAVTEEARCTVITEEDDAELGLEPCRWCIGGLANDAIPTTSSPWALVGCSIRQCPSRQTRDQSGGPTAKTARKLAYKWLREYNCGDAACSWLIPRLYQILTPITLVASHFLRLKPFFSLGSNHFPPTILILILCILFVSLVESCYS